MVTINVCDDGIKKIGTRTDELRVRVYREREGVQLSPSSF